jgi:putative exporter of polyketide antibiotics
VESALGVASALMVVTGIVAAGIAIGLVTTGDNPLVPVVGSGVLMLYGAAVAGVGFAFAGWFGSSLAMPAAATFVVSTFLLDILVPALRLPDWMRELSLTAHFGQPMLGSWDVVGVLLCLACAAGGLALGALGFTRRDLAH